MDIEAEGVVFDFTDSEGDFEGVLESEGGEEVAAGMDFGPTGDNGFVLLNDGDVESFKEGGFGGFHPFIEI